MQVKFSMEAETYQNIQATSSVVDAEIADISAGRMDNKQNRFILAGSCANYIASVSFRCTATHNIYVILSHIISKELSGLHFLCSPASWITYKI